MVDRGGGESRESYLSHSSLGRGAEEEGPSFKTTCGLRDYKYDGGKMI